ncbi:MAG: NUDIX hydrolase [Bacteroidota bacterium]|nr:NUDIX hydrolase [Bacteroidota bacterium]
MTYCVHFIFHRQRLLLLTRKNTNPFFPNIWTPIIGKIKQNEKPNDAVLRETKEETGLEIATPYFIKQLKHKGDTYWFYQSKTHTTSISLNHENDKFDFFNLSQLPDSLWQLFKEVIKES